VAKKVSKPDVVATTVQPVLNRVKTTEIPSIRERLIKAQDNKCALCFRPFGEAKRPALDHDHRSGYIRDVLCINCNGMEGRVFSLARRGGGAGNEASWLKSLVNYYHRHLTVQHSGLIHPTHKTDDQKRIALNTKARLRRKNAKS
jgi:hypothetical protein